MADYLIQDTTLDAIANAINAKTGGSSAMTPAQMVTAIGTISGGGAQTYSGDIIYQNQIIDEMTIPVDVTNKLFIARVTCVESGVVDNGVVVPDVGYVTPHGDRGNVVILAGRIFSQELCYTQRYRYTASVPDETVGDSNVSYYYGNDGARLSYVNITDITNYTTNIKIKTQNASRKWCRPGLYFKFHYEVVTF